MVRTKQQGSEKIEETLDGYRETKVWARNAHNTLSIIVIVGAVLAPILTTLSANAKDPFFSIALQAGSIIVGLMIAVSEALRRLWRPETRWKSRALAVQEIVSAREAFRDEAIPLEVGSPEWVTAFKIYRLRYEAVLKQETAEFFPSEPDTQKP